MSKSPDDKKVWYDYTCIRANIKSCQKKVTEEFNIKENNIGKKVINQLSQFHIDANSDTFLQSIRFVDTILKTSGKYEYTFCSLNANAPIENKGN